MRPTVHLERDGLSVLVLILLMPAYVIIMNVVAAVQRLQTPGTASGRELHCTAARLFDNNCISRDSITIYYSQVIGNIMLFTESTITSTTYVSRVLQVQLEINQHPNGMPITSPSSSPAPSAKADAANGSLSNQPRCPSTYHYCPLAP